MDPTEGPESEAGSLGCLAAEMVAILAQHGLGPEFAAGMDEGEVRRMLEGYALSCFLDLEFPLDFRWFRRTEYPGPNQCTSIANQCARLKDRFPVLLGQ